MNILHTPQGVDFSIKLTTVTLLVLWQLYWEIAERLADKTKPKTKKTTLWTFLRKQMTTLYGLVFAIQLLGVEILPMKKNIAIELLGFFLVIAGIAIAISARIILSDNWSHAAEYQIRKNQKLITKGIYQYIRHPIYTGLLLAMTGMELVIQSYLFIPILILNILFIYFQGRQEEKLLKKHFGKQYNAYMKKSKMILPFIF